MKKINYICSLGTLCHTSSWIKEMKMKNVLFRLISFSNINMIIDCIDTDFKLFLDRKLHIKYKNSKNKSGHKVYGGNIFNHHYILENNTYNYFVRCVNRFRILNKKKRK